MDFGQLRRGHMRLLDLVGIGQVAEIDLGEIFRARGAFHAALAGTAFGRIVGRRDLVGRGLVSALAAALASCRFFSDGLFAAFAEPAVIERDRTRLPSQNASKMPSNFSQSDFRAENRCLNAERSRPGFAA